MTKNSTIPISIFLLFIFPKLFFGQEPLTPLLQPPNYGTKWSLEPVSLENLRSDLNSMSNERQYQWITISRAINHIDMLEQLLFLKDGKDDFFAKHHSLSCLAIACQRNLITQEKFLDVAIKFSKEVKQLLHPNRASMGEGLSRTILSNFFGSPSAKIFFISVFQNFDFLNLMLIKMNTHGLLVNDGILNSFQKKLENARNLVEKGQKEAALNILGAFQNESTAQENKHLLFGSAQILKNYVDTLKAHIEFYFKNLPPPKPPGKKK